MAEGFIMLDRCLLEKHIFQNEKLLKVWIWCLLKATHQPHEQAVGLQKISLSPGQFIAGRFSAAEELKMNPSTTWKYLKVLESNESIDIKSNNKFSVVTVLNWEFYQTEKYKRDNKSDSKKTTKRQQKDTNNNVNNDNNKDQFIYAIFEHWNAKKIVAHREMTDKLKGHINSKLEIYSVDEINGAITNYATVLHSDEYQWTYKWSLGEFLTRENGMVKFLDENKPLDSLPKKKTPPPKGGQPHATPQNPAVPKPPTDFFGRPVRAPAPEV